MSVAEGRELAELERLLCQQHLNGITWRDMRPFMLTESIEIVNSEVDHSRCTVRATGHIRGGKAFSANRLVHLPPVGESFALSKVEFIGNQKREDSSMDLDMTHSRDPAVAEALEGEADT